VKGAAARPFDVAQAAAMRAMRFPFRDDGNKYTLPHTHVAMRVVRLLRQCAA